jgi:uncharacterized protein involved in exopolysaccharide biosynthesis
MKTEETVTYTDDEISLVDVWHFLQRQRKVILIVFSVITAISFSYAITRPTLYQAKASITVGERLYLQQQQIEGSDEIKYRYSSLANISPIKNTRIIEITTTSEQAKLAEEDLRKTISQILQSHDEIFEQKKAEFSSLLSTITHDNLNKRELISLLDSAATSTRTKQFAESTTVVMPYSGKFIKIFGIGTVAGIFLALILAGLIDYIQRFKANYTRQSTSLLPTQSTIKKVL